MKALAIIQIVLGVLVISVLVCPCPWSKVILGAAVLGVGIVQLIKSMQKQKTN